MVIFFLSNQFHSIGFLQQYFLRVNFLIHFWTPIIAILQYAFLLFCEYFTTKVEMNALLIIFINPFLLYEFLYLLSLHISRYNSLCLPMPVLPGEFSLRLPLPKKNIPSILSWSSLRIHMSEWPESVTPIITLIPTVYIMLLSCYIPGNIGSGRSRTTAQLWMLPGETNMRK